jgi:formiminoglutamase
MLQNWIQPVEPDLFLGNIRPDTHVFGNAILHYGPDTPDLKEVQIALVGIGDADTNAVREALYKMSFPFEGLVVADLGNMRRNDNGFLVAPIRELIDSKIFPILIGRNPANVQAQYKAFLSLQQWINLVVTDERLRVNENDADDQKAFLNDILLRKESKLFHFGLIGSQTHLMQPACFRYLEDRYFDSIRLGAARSDFAAIEPVIRDADLFALNIAALRQSDAPGQEAPAPSGFTVEEACQISRYAGMSDKLKSFGVYGFQTEWDQRQQTAQVVAQMIWYCIEGFHNRKQDFPVSTDGLVEYVVDMKDFDQPLVFWKSNKSGRWWMQLAVKAGRKLQRHRLVPCAYSDYKMACRNELPDRLLHALRRFT